MMATCLHVCFIAAILVSTGLSLPQPPRAYSQTVHEKRGRLPQTWQIGSRAAPQEIVPVRIGLKQSNVEEGANLFDDMTDFASPNYGHWWTPEQIRDFFAPQQDHVELVHTWLIDYGVNPSRIGQSANRQWIQFDASIVELEALLQTEYHEHEHSDGRIAPACEQYYVPAHLSHVIDYITPGIHLGGSSRGNVRRNLAKRSSLGANCDYAATPGCIQALYGITKGTTSTPGNELGLFQSPNFTYSQSDLDYFSKTLYPTIPQSTRPQQYSVDGAADAHGAALDVTNPEPILDLQLAFPIVWPQNITMFEVGDPYYTNKSQVYNRYFYGLMDDFLYSIDGSYCSDTSYGVGLHSTEEPIYPDKHPGGYNASKPQCGVFKAPKVISTSYSSDELSVSPNL
jgi:tripeptidyl-peptidase I